MRTPIWTLFPLVRWGLGVFVVFAVVWPATAVGYEFSAKLCPKGARWYPDNLPLKYRIHEDGSADFDDFDALVEQIQHGFGAWEAPCCSTFRTEYAGTTSQTALDAADDNSGVVLSWREKKENWPEQLGHPDHVLGVTMMKWNPKVGGCRIVSAPVVFNGIQFTYGPDGNADLATIAAHEFGHVLGLGHTARQGATMFPRYSGGTEQRTLATDDVRGLCALYGGGNCPCDDASDCPAGRDCRNGQCSSEGCVRDTDCPRSLTCAPDSGDCEILDCETSADCHQGFKCEPESGRCIPKCRVCTTCTSNEDCGSRGMCVGTPHGRRCLTLCYRGQSCPGNSNCFQIRVDSGEFYPFCANPSVCTGKTGAICEPSFTCRLDETPEVPPVCSDDSDTTGGDTGSNDDEQVKCTALGARCSPDRPGSCGPSADGCITGAADHPICSCFCRDDRDCKPSGVCMASDAGNWCVPRGGRAQPDRPSDDGCGCRTPSGSPSPWLLAVAVLLFAGPRPGTKSRT